MPDVEVKIGTRGGSVVYGGTGGGVPSRAFYIGRWLLKRTVKGAIVIVAAKALYEVGRQLFSTSDTPAELVGDEGPAQVAEIAMPPMWQRDP